MSSKIKKVVRKSLIAGSVVIGGASSAMAQTPTDYGAVLNTNLGVVETIWAAVAVIMIGVALVTVGTRFFRKAR